MNSKSVIRWAKVVAAIPAGLVSGFFLASQICVAVLHAQGKGNSHNDIITLAIWQMLGAAFGALVLPMVIWQFTKSRQNEADPDRQRTTRGM
ncbi:MAG: hypothetical protein HZA32_21385 [Opitutae bacterium]|nr:hypothetical protein [Opitutae bacterium]